MTAFGVIPCTLCGGTGWITRIDIHGYGYDDPCPNQCPQPELPPVAQDADVPP